MSQEDSVKDRYASPAYLANYLAMEWGDILFPENHPLIGEPDPREQLDDDRTGQERVGRLKELYRPGAFYRDVSDQVILWCAAQGIRPQRLCDIGGSTGRLVYELYQKVEKELRTSPLEFLLVEQSETFCHWARRLLTPDADDPWDKLRGDREGAWWVPLPWFPERTSFDRVDVKDVRSRLSSLRNVAICCALGEDTPRPDGYFDVVIALNVVDRHSSPKPFVRQIARLIKPCGLLVLASPFDFNQQFTPRKEGWVHDLQDLLPDGWQKIGMGEATYVHRVHRWRYLSYICQVVGAVAPNNWPH